MARSASRWCSVPPPSISPVVASTAAMGISRPLAASAGRWGSVATRSPRPNAGRLPASRSAASVNAGRRPSTSASVGARSSTTPSVIPAFGIERRSAGSRIPGGRPALRSSTVDMPARVPRLRRRVATAGRTARRRRAPPAMTPADPAPRDRAGSARLERVHSDRDRDHEPPVDRTFGIVGHVDVVDVADLEQAGPPHVAAEDRVAAHEVEVVRDRQPVGVVADVRDEADEPPEERHDEAALASAGNLVACGTVHAVRRAQEALAEDLLDLADLAARIVGHVVARARVEPLARLQPHELDVLRVVRVEADVLLELEPRLLDEADG